MIKNELLNYINKEKSENSVNAVTLYYATREFRLKRNLESEDLLKSEEYLNQSKEVILECKYTDQLTSLLKEVKRDGCFILEECMQIVIADIEDENTIQFKRIIPTEYKFDAKINTEGVKETVLNIYEGLVKSTLDKIFLDNWNVKDGYYNLQGFVTKAIRLAEKALDINIRNNSITWDIYDESYSKTESIISNNIFKVVHNSYDDVVIAFK